MTLNFEPQYIDENSTDTDGPNGGWERVDTSSWELERVNDLYSPYQEDITGILQWDGERNDAPIQPLIAVERCGEHWSLYRPNWFSNKLELVKDGPITARTKDEIITKAYQWQAENPVSTAHDMLNPPIDD